MASEVSVLGDEQEESMEALSGDLERSAISPDSTLYQPSSSQEETQSTTDDSISQAMCVQFPRPPDNTGKGKVAALQWFVDECSIGPLDCVKVSDTANLRRQLFSSTFPQKTVQSDGM